MFLRSLILCLLTGLAHADIQVIDDTGAPVRLATPARRIVSLAPNITENLYAAGAGDRLVGAVDYSDYPDAAKRLPSVGAYSSPDLEAIVALKPDLVVAWQSGNPAATLDKLKTLGLTVYLTEAGRLDDIPNSIEKFGRLAGSEATAAPTAARLHQRMAQLRAQHGARPQVSVFYQIWHQPLLTVGGGQVISDAIRLCGGKNVFSDLAGKSPAVSMEAVLAADPEVIVASGMGLGTPIGLDDWRRWSRLKANQHDNLFFVHPDLLQRATPRLLEGITQLCGHLETARARR
jgi:iron complex transport system substrate-binding protein